LGLTFQGEEGDTADSGVLPLLVEAGMVGDDSGWLLLKGKTGA